MKAEEFDQRFDRGEDITEELDLSKARRPGEEQRRRRAVRSAAVRPLQSAAVPFERSILVIAVLATVAFLGAGVYSFFDPQLVEMRLHVLLTLGAVLLVVFPHLWIGLYLFGTGRAIRREVAEGRADADAVPEADRHLRRALPPLLLASLAALGTVALGQGILAGTAEPWHHITAFALTLLLQLWALLVERQSLARNAALLDRLEATTAPSIH